MTKPTEPTKDSAQYARTFGRALEAFLPAHAARLSLEHNDHKAVYEPVEDHYQFLDDDAWVSPIEKQKAIETDSVWVIQWYPDTPVGFYHKAASTLEALFEWLMKECHQNE